MFVDRDFLAHIGFFGGDIKVFGDEVSRLKLISLGEFTDATCHYHPVKSQLSIKFTQSHTKCPSPMTPTTPQVL